MLTSAKGWGRRYVKSGRGDDIFDLKFSHFLNEQAVSLQKRNLKISEVRAPGKIWSAS